jgi:hypothetical protein
LKVIILQLSKLLGLFQTEANILHELITLCQGLGNSNDSNLTSVIGFERWQVTTIDHMERSLLESCVERCVINILFLRKLSKPLSWAITREAPQIHVDGLVHHLYLSISLPISMWVKC